MPTKAEADEQTAYKAQRNAHELYETDFQQLFQGYYFSIEEQVEFERMIAKQVSEEAAKYKEKEEAVEEEDAV